MPGEPARTCRAHDGDIRGGPDVRAGVDSDHDGHPDSIFTADGDDLLLHTDTDADGHADRALRLRPDGTVADEGCPEPPSPVETLLGWLRIR